MISSNETGRKKHTYEELEDGARQAWRNSARCIGRLTWKALRVVDRRDCESPQQVFDACLEHLEASTNGGQIVPTITIFEPYGPRIHNTQLLRYADDPEQRPFVEELGKLGWRPSGEPFQMLPLLISWPGHPPLLREIPPSLVLEVPLQHPDYPWFEKLGWRWHALPAMSDRIMVIDDVLYQCAPFSGWYMSTEIGARNLADETRYDFLPVVAGKLGLDTRSERTLWKDRALLELNRAVLWSFEKAGVTLVDHHTASKQFLKFKASEEALGETLSAEWDWIVPPMSGSTTAVFHTPMRVERRLPNFLEREELGEL